jgi:hypothetical protein
MKWGRLRDANLRSRVQVLESRQRLAVAAIDEFLKHLIAAGQEAPINTMAELAGEISAIRLLLSGTGEVDDVRS